MLKKLMSVTLSAVMFVASVVSTPALAASSSAASVDLSAPLDGFTQSELAASYTATSPYQKGGFTAPTMSGLGARLVNDDSIDDYVRVEYTADVAAAPNGGASLTDENFNVKGTGDNTALTFDVTLRRNTNKRVYFYLLTENGSRETLMLWWNSDSSNRLWWGGSKHNTELILADNTWYKLRFSLDLKNKIYKVTVNGGEHDGITHTCDSSKFTLSSDTVFDGIGIGYLTSVEKGDSFDIAEGSLSNTASVAYDDTITFDAGTFSSSSTSYAKGAWKTYSGHFTNWSGKYSVADMGTPHGKALRFESGGTNHFWFEHNLPTGTVSSDGVLIAEGSYYENTYSQFVIDAKGTAGSLSVLSYSSSSSWSINCLGNNLDNNSAAMEMPRKLSAWVKVRVIFDIGADDLILQYWKEDDPAGSLVTATRKDALAAFDDITQVTFKLYNKFGGYQCVDDLRVYSADSLRYTGSEPMNGTADGVSLTDALTAEFNMPLADSALTNVTMTLTDSENSVVNGTKTFNANRTGISFKPDSALSLEETYTLNISGTVVDIFGQILPIDKSISFTTDELFELKSCIFKQDDAEVASSGEIVGGRALTADVSIGINGGNPAPVAVTLALYDAKSDKFIAGDVAYTDNLTSISHTLSVDVPNDGYSYYPAVFVWNSLSNPAPYIDAVVLK